MNGSGPAISFTSTSRSLPAFARWSAHHRQPAAGPLCWRRIQPGPRAIDDTTRLAYVEVLPDEQQSTMIGFLSQALAWFNGHGIECRQVMSDNGSIYISKASAKACSLLKLKHIRTRLYTPRSNGKAERFIQTHFKEWLYAMPFQNSQDRNAWLPRYLSIDNRLRKHSILSGRFLQQRTYELLC